MFSFDNIPDLNALNARALDNVRAMTAWKHRNAGLAKYSADVQPIGSVGIIGAGVMGAEIAAAHVKHYLPVTIFDNNPAALSTITDRTGAELAAEDGGRNDLAPVDRLLHPVKDLNKALKCDVIIESVEEKLSSKQGFFKSIQNHIAPNVLLVSNTSSIPIKKLAEGISLPERFCGMHFFHPVRQRPLVEIVRGPKTSEAAVATLVEHVKSIDKLPVVVADGPGFLINRLLLPYLIEALELLMEGASIEEIERAAVEFGMAKGPFRLMDEIGLDTTLQAGWSMAAAFPDRIPGSPLLVTMIKSGRLGQKAGAGFFSHADLNSSAACLKPDPEAIKIIQQWAKPSCHHSAEDMILRLLLPMILEATRILDEGKVRDPRDIDLGAIFGLGFPARRGGLLWWANTIKPAGLIKMLGPLQSIGPRLQPTPLLLDLAAQGDSFTLNFSP